VIGNPLETTIALSHLIFEGTLDRFPGLKIMAAHSGGFLPSYSGRSDTGCPTVPIFVREARTAYQEEAVGLPQADVLRHHGVQRGRCASPRGRGGRGPLGGRHRLSVSVDEDAVDLILQTPGLSDAIDGHPGRTAAGCWGSKS